MPVNIISSSANATAECCPAETGDPSISQAGTTNEMNGCAAYQIGRSSHYVAEVRMLPGVQNVQLIGAGITQCDPENVTNQYQVTLSLSGNGHPPSIVLSPVPANCRNQVTEFVSPAAPLYLFSSRNVAIARCSVDKNTFSPTCTVTAAGLQGETEITIVNPRACNSMFTGAIASPTAGGSTASLRVIVLA